MMAMIALLFFPSLVFPSLVRQASESTPSAPSALEVVRAEAESLAAIVESELGAAFLSAARDLPARPGVRTFLWNRSSGKALTEEQAAGRSAAELAGFEPIAFDEYLYYHTFYGTPIAYTRALDLAGRNGIESVDGARVFDFGYGGIGHLRMLASLGADAVGVEVSEILRLLYADPSDTGQVPRARAAGDGERGRVTLHHGSFPADPELVGRVGEGYRLVLSKNVLKRGYVHPEREADPRSLVHLGVADEVFACAVLDMLEPGGLFVIYNVYGVQNPPGERYLPMATGGCPFERGLLEDVGFEVVAYDQDDTPVLREMAQRLGWDEGEKDGLEGYFGMVTILRKPR